MVYPYNEIIFGNKNNEVLTYETTWMDFENTMLSERSQSEKEHIYLFMQIIPNRQIYRGNE